MRLTTILQYLDLMLMTAREMQARFQAKKKDILGRLAVPAGEYTDLSPKGSVDGPVRELVDDINRTAEYVTTSSCSGRVVVYLEGPPRSTASDLDEREGESGNEVNGVSTASTSAGGKGGGRWLFTSHVPIDLKGLGEQGQVQTLLGLEPTKMLSFPPEEGQCQRVHLKFEPMILHILTSSHAEAQTALTAAVTSGFRESGISGLTDTKGQPTLPMVAVRTSGLAFDTTVGFLSDGKVLLMVPETYLYNQLKWANYHFQMNEERKARFRHNFLAATSTTSKSTTTQGERKSKPLSEKQRRKEARKEASRKSFERVRQEPPDIQICDETDDEDGPEADLRNLMGG
ncbi:uncharacterized protein LTR77_000371 [Saxophila tyrrhenica]|uniref:tRNA(Phe) 7-[(3-amino-3-carboxypropyl)-4-demethylwyosine(37)-N(4)]-methyltransferase n=1 Tax=Saxophila tyrrhenica TaxID=1690608 RepID=A0AAV9PMH7_9PEZI|nr:hypothetical protein LTR77_000371 [Saxophila tyrrhenica]